MAQSNLILDKQKTKKNNKRNFRTLTVIPDTNHLSVCQYPALGQPQLQLDKPIPNLKTISILNPSECDVVTLLSTPKPTIVNLIGNGNSQHIPSTNIKVFNTNPLITPPAINTDKERTANTATDTAGNTVKVNSKNMGRKRNKAKQFAKAQARLVAAQTAAQAAAQILVPVTGNATISIPSEAANPPGLPENAIQPPSETVSMVPNTFINREKNEISKFNSIPWQKKKGFSVNLKWTASGAAASNTSNKPGTSDSPEILETSQDMQPVTSKASESPTDVSTPETNQGSKIPALENTTKIPSITLKTKKNLQQEMVRQRLNWIKPDANTAGNVPGTSAALQIANQSVPTNDAPQIVEPPQVTPAGPTPGSTIPILGSRSVEPTPRSNAGSFFVKSLPLLPPPRGLDTLFAYRYPKGIPRSFLMQQNKSLEPGGSPITADSPIWPNNTNIPAYLMNTPTLVQPPTVNMGDNNTNPPPSPTFGQTENPVEVQRPYSPSDIYLEGTTNPEPPELESESSDQIQSGQKRLSAFHRLGPLSQPKKPKLTINLNLKKDQPIREVVNDSDDDQDKYTPVHLRKHILTSTDETVTTYLPNWPWRKNVAVRKSVTANSSRSVMILQQEQMEEAYEKDNVFIQITVKGYPSTWTKERVLDAILDNVRGYSLIPCFTEFYQHECKFLVLRSRSALLVLHKTGFYIHKDGVELTVTISIPIFPDRLDFIPRIILRKRMVMGYDDPKLNLSAFTLQEDISHFIYFPLNRLSNQSECSLLQNAVNWNRLIELDLSHNRLTDISGFDLFNLAPRLKHLNLSHNCIERATILIHERPLPLKTIHLEGNPLCNDFTDPDHYVKVIRMMFPEVVEIDGVPIHQRGKLPNHKQNYCPEEAQEVTEKFLEIYFPLLDSGSDDRSLIQGMYEDDATLTITYCYKLRYGQIYRNFRNLFLYARFLDEGETDSVVGAMAITKLINRWPHTEHDPFTFTVDVLYHTEMTTILKISGVLKLAAETLAEDEHLLSFTRTVVLHSEDGAEYKIHNEMVYWNEPSAAAARSAFRVNTISQKNFNLKIESTNDEDLRDKFLKIFMKLTAMNRKVCERCLEINNWNFKLALEHFTKLLKINNLESLTQEVQAAS